MRKVAKSILNNVLPSRWERKTKVNTQYTSIDVQKKPPLIELVSTTSSML